MNILVASATANTGSKLVEILSANGTVKVKALVRNPASEGAKALAALPNVTIVTGDFSDVASIKAALIGIDRAFLVSPAGEDAQYDREVAFISSATEAGVEAVVRISTYGALIGLTTKCVYAKAHARIEKYVEEHNSRVIDLQPNWFMSNWLSSAAEAKATGKITMPVADNLRATAMVDTRDVAGAAAAILLQPKEKLEDFIKLRYVQVHGPELKTFAEKAEALSKATGKTITVNTIPPEAFSSVLQGFGMSEYFANSFTDTILTVGGGKEGERPHDTECSPLLLEVWKPKYTVDMWAKDHASLFA